MESFKKMSGGNLLVEGKLAKNGNVLFKIQLVLSRQAFDITIHWFWCKKFVDVSY